MGMIPAMQYTSLTNPAAGTSKGGSLWLAPDCVGNWSMQVSTTGTLTGAFRFYKSSDPRARQDHPDYAKAKWVEFTTDVAASITNPAGAPVSFLVKQTDFPDDFLRMDYAQTGGAGTVEAFFSGHGH